MRYKLFGRSGMRVAELCLGTMTFGSDMLGAGRDQDRKIFDAYGEAGGNFIDTANIYSGGQSETLLSDFLASNREYFVLATKYSNTMKASDVNAGGNHRKNMVQALEASLKRLNTDYVDLYWVHIWDATTPTEEIMRALDDLVRAGKVLHVGASNVPAWLVSRANTIAELRGWTPFSGLQMHYNLLERSIEADFVPMAQALDMAITPWSPLAGGYLSGKFASDTAEKDREGSRIASTGWGNLYRGPNTQTIVDKVAEIASEVGRSSAQVALNWMRQNANVSMIPIVGARTFDQFQDNMACLDFALSDDQMATLNEVSALRPAYPSSLLANPMQQKMIHGDGAELLDNHRVVS